MGVFARDIADLALALEVLAGYGERDPDTRPRARAPYQQVAAEEPPIPPTFGFAKTARWEEIDADAREAFGELVELLGERVEEVELLPSDAPEWHRITMDVEMALNLAREWEHGRDRLSAPLRARIESGRAARAYDYLRARAAVPQLLAGLTELFEQRYDALITPATFGTAPLGLESTGDPAFCSTWTLLGVPTLSLPLMTGANGLPLGVQLVGARDTDARLLRTGRWLVERVGSG